MSTRSSLLHGARELLFPARCAACGRLLEARHEWICVPCLGKMPSTYYHLEADNPMASKLKSLHPAINNAATQFFYIHSSNWREVIHKIKYRNAWRLAQQLGYWYGCELIESPLYQDIDLIIPIPLHRSRRVVRRYNQSEKIAEGIAKALGVEVSRNSLYRVRNNPSQVTRSRSERWDNVQNLFRVAKPKRLEGKHILLIDDVFTTGATILSCAESILTHVDNCRISVATLAASRKELIGSAI